MNFLAPLFLIGLGAVSVPVVIHLINRERKVVVEFPSLMFLRRIPYKSVRRQKIRHLLLLLLRCLALALLAAAFARPFFTRHAAAASTAGAREVVILLDQSASMGYGTRWARAKDAARRALSTLRAGDRATLVLFANDASVASQPMATPDQIRAAIGAAKLGAEATRYGGALKLASQILGASTLPRREVVLISDYQANGWASHNELVFPRGTTFTPVDLGGAAPDVAVSQVTTDRDSTGARDRVTVAARLVNTGASPKSVDATLAVGGRDAESQRVTVPPSGMKQVVFSPLAVPANATRGRVRITRDSLPADDAFSFVIAPDDAVPVLIVEPATPRANQALYLSRALSIGDRPAFRVDVKSVDSLVPRDVEGRALVVLDEVAPPAGAVGARLLSLLAGGAGLVLVPGETSTATWPQVWRAVLPATPGAVVDRTADAGGTLSAIDYAHPIFEIFNSPRGGDFSTARFYRYRTLTPQTGASVVARFDDGSPALVERADGAGRIVMWASSLDAYWTNLPLQPVFLPFVHQLGAHVGRYADPRSAFMAGDVLDLSRHGELTERFLSGRAADSAAELVLESPSGARQRVTAAAANHLATLSDQGFYELRGRDTPAGSGRPIAVNVAPGEMNLAHMDPAEIGAAITAPPPQGRADAAFDAGTPRDEERRQRLWWYLLLGALLVMAAETALSNRLSRQAAS
jgi:hypothetical protein